MSDAIGHARSLLTTTANIVAKYSAANRLSVTDLRDLICSVHSSLCNLGEEPAILDEVISPSAATVRKSLSDPNYIISLIDGKPYRTLKRHLAKHGHRRKDNYYQGREWQTGRSNLLK